MPCRMKRKAEVVFHDIDKAVAAREVPSYEQKIPFRIMQTFRCAKVGPKVKRNVQNLLRFNAEYSYLLVTDEDAVRLIDENFPLAVRKAWDFLSAGAAKGDLVRYCMLYHYGGVYLDMDSTFVMPLREIVDRDASFYIGLEPDGASPVNWAMMFVAQHPLVLKLLRECVRRVLTKECKHIFDATGPNLYSDVLVEHMSGKTLRRTRKTLAERREIVSKGIDGGRMVPTQLSNPWRYTFRGYTQDQLYTDCVKRYCPLSSVTYRLYADIPPLAAAKVRKLLDEFDASTSL